MDAIEVKFLYEGIVFTSKVFVSRISNSLNSYEFSINFFSKYLISKYSECYYFILENNRFNHTYTQSKEEEELIKTIQKAIFEIPQIINKILSPAR